ncbi:hypothetical protein ACFQL0_19635 [Haloplanus litoreus]|uniref:hypothetical protein n=1 Tax=Haloplanus litoreus TaxID=767515 RepID=UPI0036229218
MTEHALSAIGAGIFVGILGVLIKYVGVVDLIAGYDPEKVADEEGQLTSLARTHSTLRS